MQVSLARLSRKLMSSWMFFAGALLAFSVQDSYAQQKRDADLPVGRTPDPYELYRRLAKVHSLPPIGQKNVEKYKELLKSIDKSFLDDLSAEEKHNLRNLARQVLSKADSPDELQNLGDSIKGIENQIRNHGTVGNLLKENNEIESAKDLANQLKANGIIPSKPSNSSSGPDDLGSFFNNSRSESSRDDEPSTARETRKEMARTVNKMLADAAQRTIEQNADDNGSSNGQSSASAKSNSIWEQLIESIQETVADDSFKKQYGRPTRNFFNRLKDSTSSKSFYKQFSMGPKRLPSMGEWSSANTIILVTLFLAAISFFGFVFMQRRNAQSMVGHPRVKKPRTLPIAKITTRSQLVLSVDQMICWLSEQDAQWWNANQIRTYLTKRFPEQNKEINTLVRCYENARYRELNVQLEPAQFSECRHIMICLIDLHIDRLSAIEEAV